MLCMGNRIVCPNGTNVAGPQLSVTVPTVGQNCVGIHPGREAGCVATAGAGAAVAAGTGAGVGATAVAGTGARTGADAGVVTPGASMLAPAHVTSPSVVSNC